MIQINTKQLASSRTAYRFFFVCLFLLLQTGHSKPVYLQNGRSIEATKVEVEGDTLIVHFEGGSMGIAKEKLAPATRLEYFGPPPQQIAVQPMSPLHQSSLQRLAPPVAKAPDTPPPQIPPEPSRITVSPPTTTTAPPPGSSLPPKWSDLHIGNFADEWGRKMPFRLFIPTGPRMAKSCALILSLHGIGEAGTDNERQLKIQPQVLNLITPAWQAKQPAFLLAPQHPKGERWADENMTDLSPSASIALEILNEVIHTYPSIDPNRIYITGYSSGGAGTFDIVWKTPGKFAAAVPTSSAWLPANIRKDNLIPLWVVIAKGDKGLVEALPLVTDKIKNLGGAPRVTLVDGGHGEGWKKAYSNQELITWLYQQRRAGP